MNKNILILLLSALPVFGLLSCSETDDTEEEFVDWQNTNETYFNNIYAQAIASTTDELDTIRKYTLTNAATTTKDDYIVVEKLESGTSTSGSPMFTDSVKISYRGRLLPSTSYAEGYVFDQTYKGDFNWQSSGTASEYISNFIIGFSTALQHMVIGDRWRVYIPYKLAYGESGSSSSGVQVIPGYSTLIFDIALYAFYRPDAGSQNVNTTYVKGQTPLKQWITK